MIIIGLLLTTGIVYGQPEVEWQRLYGGENPDFFTAHIRTVNDGWAFTGYVLNGMTFDIYLVVTDGEGQLIFEETYPGEEIGKMGWDLVQTDDGGYLIGGDWQVVGRGNFGAVRADGEADFGERAPRNAHLAA